MTNEQLNILDGKLSECWNVIDRATDKAIIKILDHYGLDIDYVRAHPDEFRILVSPCYGLDDITISYAIEHKATILGLYTVHSYFDPDTMLIKCRVEYSFGGDP